ncbi:MAG TPA: ATP-binding protein [Chitinophagaceae bacterium]|nr:ATP-binding protein [Chitinophagaceae bacterium]
MLPDSLISENADLLQLLIAAYDEERDELGHSLHENVNQLLASARLLLELAREGSQGNTALLDKGLLYLAKASLEIRKISWTLNSAAVDDTGLEAAIEELLAARHESRHIQARLDYDKGLDALLPPALKLMVYRVIQEQVNNIYRHSGATQVHVILKRMGEGLAFSIGDNGLGFDISQPPKGMGFIIIGHRVASFGGMLRLHSAPGKGCRLHIHLPVAGHV